MIDGDLVQKSNSHLPKTNLDAFKVPLAGEIHPRKRLHFTEDDLEEHEIPLEEHLLSPSKLDKKSIFGKLGDHIKDLQNDYFSSCPTDIEYFSKKLLSIAKYSQFREVSTLNLGQSEINPRYNLLSNVSSPFNASNIVSSIEFNRESLLFATAGVSKRIRIFGFNDCLNPDIEVHCPLGEILTKSKISCISWNPYITPQVGCADYEGVVSIYDTNTGQLALALEEHDKRAWSIAYCNADPTKIASGSDDSHVKIWSLNMRRSVLTIDGRANVCSVNFDPFSNHVLSFGSADHNIYIYDLRNPKRSLQILQGHGKAVSYVRYFDQSSNPTNERYMASASTDCSLKLWKTTINEKYECIRSYSGHVNEKNFVGMSTLSSLDLLACGSENNAVYCYHRDLRNPLAIFGFDTTLACQSLLRAPSLEPQNHYPRVSSPNTTCRQPFISSLCWRPLIDSEVPVLLAANSQGTIKIITLESQV